MPATLSEFEPHIQATRHLVDFLRAGAHSSHARFLFTSSVTSAQSWPLTRGPYPEEIVTDPSIAVGPGYGASKYVAERIIAKSGLNATSFRIGQICGGAPQGAWDTTEWTPILVKTSIALRSFPDIKGILSWIPMDVVAAAIVEAASSNELLSPAVNLVNPHLTSCDNMNAYLIGAVKKFLGVHLDLVPMRQWISGIERFAVNASADTLKDV
ncbi:hypothetical protein H0H93_009569, partial [Arthromyces matolae]